MGWMNRLALSLLRRNLHPLLLLPPPKILTSTSPRNLGTRPHLPPATAPNLQSPPPLHDSCRSVVGIAIGADMEKELDKLRPKLSLQLAIDVVRALTDRNISALRFFNWISTSPNGLPPDPVLYNLVINNLFLVGNHDAVADVLSKHTLFRFSLTEDAFGFLNLRNSSAISSRDSHSLGRVVEIVRGSRFTNSGIDALASVLRESGLQDLAILVVDRRRTSYLNALIAAKCRSGDFHGANALLCEMKRWNRNPMASSYNYLLGGLFKNGRVVEGCGLLRTMEESGRAPDEVTYEVLVCRACRIGSVDAGVEFVEKMIREGLRPRLTTHAVIIKGFFRLGRVGDARKYVVDMCERDSHCANVNYSLLANLLRMAGRVVEGAAVLDEMMTKRLKPNFPVYTKLEKDLRRIGRDSVASNLKYKFSMFPSSRKVR